MSIEAITAVLTHSEATGSNRLVMIALANHADRETFEAYPSIATICDLTKQKSERNVRRILGELVDAGELELAGKWKRGIKKYILTPGGRSRGELNQPRLEEAAIEETTPASGSLCESGDPGLVEPGSETQPRLLTDQPRLEEAGPPRLEEADKPSSNRKGTVVDARSEEMKDLFSFFEGKLGPNVVNGWGLVSQWLNEGATPELIKSVATTLLDRAERAGKAIKGLAYFAGAVREAIAEAQKPVAIEVKSHQWPHVVGIGLDNGKWLKVWGPRLGEHGCAIPGDVIDRLTDEQRQTLQTATVVQ